MPRTNLDALRQNPETARAGMKWDAEEENTLLHGYLNDNKTFDQLQEFHKRTIGSLKSRVIGCAINAMNADGITMEAASERFKVQIDDIVRHISYNDRKCEKRDLHGAARESRKEKENKKNTVVSNNQDVEKMLTEIRTLLETVLRKIDAIKIT